MRWVYLSICFFKLLIEVENNSQIISVVKSILTSLGSHSRGTALHILFLEPLESLKWAKSPLDWATVFPTTVCKSNRKADFLITRTHNKRHSLEPVNSYEQLNNNLALAKIEISPFCPCNFPLPLLIKPPCLHPIIRTLSEFLPEIVLSN